MSEERRDIKGYEGLYQVIDQGHVKSLERKVRHWRGGERIQKERILKPSNDRGGYLLVSLCDGEKRKTYTVHRLVCQAFHENPENKPCVNHIDENKTNNCASNLEWCTYAENNTHGTRIARVAKACSKPVGQYTLDGELVKIWQSPCEAGKQIGLSDSHVSKVANGKLKQAYGFIWRYV